jgi:hypothetical protein
MRTTIPSATSVDDECRMMGQCSCGGEWSLTFNEVAVRRRIWVDYIVVRCVLCNASAAFEFDVSRFFEARPGVWGRTLAAGRGTVAYLGRFPRTRAPLAGPVRTVA